MRFYPIGLTINLITPKFKEKKWKNMNIIKDVTFPHIMGSKSEAITELPNPPQRRRYNDVQTLNLLLETCHELNHSFQCSLDVKKGKELSHQARTSLETTIAISHSKKMWRLDSTLPLQEGQETTGISISCDERFKRWGNRSKFLLHMKMLTFRGRVLS